MGRDTGTIREELEAARLKLRITRQTLGIIEEQEPNNRLAIEEKRRHLDEIGSNVQTLEEELASVLQQMPPEVLAPKAPREGFARGHAFLVGVGGDLPNTVDDAVGLAGILRDTGRCAYPPGQVHELTGGRATRATILTALDELARSTDSQSTVIVYFSGHGYRISSSEGETYYLLPYGYDLARLSESGISGAEFIGKLGAIRAQKLLLVLDCCHAGGVGDAKAPGMQMVKSPLPDEAQNLLAEGSGRVLIASSREDELSFAGRPYSAFTLALVEALSGIGVAKEDGYVHVVDLVLHAREVVPQRTGGRQHPILDFEEASNFVLAYYAGGGAQPKGLPFDGEPEIELAPGVWVTVGRPDPVLPRPHAGRAPGPAAASSGAVAAELYRAITHYLDKGEFQTLCFDLRNRYGLAVAYDDLPGDTFRDKARALVEQLNRQEALPRIVNWLRREPGINAIPSLQRKLDDLGFE
jgi:hypothetical protein